MCSSSKGTSSDSADIVQLCVRVIDDQCVDEERNKEKIVNHLKAKLIKAHSNCGVAEEKYHRECDDIVNHGIFNENVISKLLKSGTSREDVINIMKYGLESREFQNPRYFYILNLTKPSISQELVEKLKSLGLSNEKSWNIILKGLVYQDECCLFQLTLRNVFVAKILNWQGPITRASNSVMEFLEKLGIDEHTLKIVSEKGISAEARQIIKDLGFSESKQRIDSENIEPTRDCTDGIYEKNSNSRSIRSSCGSRGTHGSRSQESCEPRHVLRNNLLVPLTWALSETLKCNPTDPVHYVACQLLRWKYNNVVLSEVKQVTDFLKNAP